MNLKLFIVTLTYGNSRADGFLLPSIEEILYGFFIYKTLTINIL